MYNYRKHGTNEPTVTHRDREEGTGHAAGPGTPACSGFRLTDDCCVA